LAGFFPAAVFLAMARFAEVFFPASDFFFAGDLLMADFFFGAAFCLAAGFLRAAFLATGLAFTREDFAAVFLTRERFLFFLVAIRESLPPSRVSAL
jgi:hypothetical protein